MCLGKMRRKGGGKQMPRNPKRLRGIVGGGNYPISRVLWRQSSTVCHLSKLAVACKHYRSTLRRNKVLGGQPSNAGLRELSTSHCTARTSPCARWALTPPSHPCSPCGGRLFSSAVCLPSRITSISEGDCPVLPGLSSCENGSRRRQTGLLPFFKKLFACKITLFFQTMPFVPAQSPWWVADVPTGARGNRCGNFQKGQQ